jgi:hypothetical protein
VEAQAEEEAEEEAPEGDLRGGPSGDDISGHELCGSSVAMAMAHRSWGKSQSFQLFTRMPLPNV